jgi:hypothetical protein
MISKQVNKGRTYPIKKCKNPDCDYGENFTPHDKRQVFCNDQCRSNYHNDIKSLKLKSEFQVLEQIKRNDRILKDLYLKYFKEGNAMVHHSILFHEGIDPKLATKDLMKSGRVVKQLLNYGLEMHPDDFHYYIINKIK